MEKDDDGDSVEKRLAVLEEKMGWVAQTWLACRGPICIFGRARFKSSSSDWVNVFGGLPSWGWHAGRTERISSPRSSLLREVSLNCACEDSVDILIVLFAFCVSMPWLNTILRIPAGCHGWLIEGISWCRWPWSVREPFRITTTTFLWWWFAMQSFFMRRGSSAKNCVLQ